MNGARRMPAWQSQCLPEQRHSRSNASQNNAVEEPMSTMTPWKSGPLEPALSEVEVAASRVQPNCAFRPGVATRLVVLLP